MTPSLRIVFGTVVRSAPVRRGGELVLVDWERKRILASRAVVPENPSIDHDPNPRGNTRGCRGIHLVDSSIVAASYHSLLIFDHALEPLGAVSHGLMVNLHEIHGDDRSVWVSSTAVDAALRYDLASGELLASYWPREMPSFQNELGLEPMDLDKSVDNRLRYLGMKHSKSPSHTHLNAVVAHGGDVWALLNRHGAVVRLSTGDVVVRDPRLRGSHNLLFLPNGWIVVNGTQDETVRFYDAADGSLKQVIRLLDFPEVRESYRRARRRQLVPRVLKRVGLHRRTISKPVFVRGLDHDGEHLFVGISPATVLRLDWARGSLVDSFVYSDEPNTCVHGLRVIPESS